MIRIVDTAYNDILTHSKESYPHECCGVLLGRSGNLKGVMRVRRASNTNEERAEDRYNIDPAELNRIDKEAREAGLDVLGFYHSHPDHPVNPSGFDRDRAFAFYSYIIVSVLEGAVDAIKSWSFEEEGEPFSEEEIRISSLE